MAINEENNFPLADIGNTVTLDNSITQEGNSTRRGGPDRPLTSDESRRVKRLVHQGMSQRLARAEVLGEDGADVG